MRHQRFFHISEPGDRIVRPPDVIECASNERTTKESQHPATRSGQSHSVQRRHYVAYF